MSRSLAHFALIQSSNHALFHQIHRMNVCYPLKGKFNLKKRLSIRRRRGEKRGRIVKMLIMLVIINSINFRCLTSQFLITKECRVSLLHDFPWMAFQMAPSFWMRFLTSTIDLEKWLIFFQKCDRDVVCVWRFPRYLYRESLPVKSHGLLKRFIGAGQGT